MWKLINYNFYIKINNIVKLLNIAFSKIIKNNINYLKLKLQLIKKY